MAERNEEIKTIVEVNGNENIISWNQFQEYLEGEEVPALEKFFNREEEENLLYFFQTEDLKLLDSDFKVNLQHHWRPAEGGSILDNCTIWADPNCNPLLEAMPYTYYDIAEYLYEDQYEKLHEDNINNLQHWYDLFLFDITETYLEMEKKTEITAQDVRKLFNHYYDLTKLYNDQQTEIIIKVIDSYENMIKSLLEDIEEALQEKWDELTNNIYTQTLDNIYNNFINFDGTTNHYINLEDI